LIPHLVTRRLKSAIGNPGTAQFELLSEKQAAIKDRTGDSDRKKRKRELHDST